MPKEQVLKGNINIMSASIRNSISLRKSAIENSNNEFFMKDYVFIRNYKQGEVFGDSAINNRGERFFFIFLLNN